VQAVASSRQTVLVTGAGTGIGRAIAQAIGATGASVWLIGRRPGPLAETAATIDGARLLAADITRTDAVERLARAVDGVDVLIHCAGTIATGRTQEAAIDDLDDQYAANVRGPYLLTQALLPRLRSSGRGEIVFIGSTSALGPRPGVGQFAATQAALRSLADTLRAEVNEHGVRVTTLHVGRTATGRQRHLHALEGREYRPDELMQPEDVAAMVVAAINLPRTAEVTEIVMRPMQKPR
jgi:NADP-dependent 3-hydroxy acid dehydrogenase YdfG